MIGGIITGYMIRGSIIRFTVQGIKEDRNRELCVFAKVDPDKKYRPEIKIGSQIWWHSPYVLIEPNDTKLIRVYGWNGSQFDKSLRYEKGVVVR